MTTLKIQLVENEPYCASPEILPFFRMRFINFFLACMVQKYQNERAPIFYYGNSPKNSKKDQKVAGLQLLDWIQPFWMTRYIHIIIIYNELYSYPHWLFFEGPPRCDSSCCRSTEDEIEGERCDAPGCFESCVDDSSYHDDTVEI